MISRVAQGTAAEDLALRYLEARGLSLVTRNFRCRTGELDLIMRDGEHLVFVEVRSRRSTRYGTPAESVTRTKQQRLLRAAALLSATPAPRPALPFRRGGDSSSRGRTTNGMDSGCVPA